MKTNYIALLLFSYFSNINSLEVNITENQILGKWMSTDENVTVLVFKERNLFNAKVIWFDDSDDKNKPMNTRTDQQNPVIALRNRKIIGLEVLRNLIFNASTNRWEKGIIYDAKTGKEWNSSAFLTKNGMLEIKGFWHFEFISKSMTFKKIG